MARYVSHIEARLSPRESPNAIAGNGVRGTALFSFEGVDLRLLFRFRRRMPWNANEGAAESHRLMIFENCIKKNFHVARHEIAK